MKTYNLVILYGQVISLIKSNEKEFLTLKFSEKAGQEIKVVVRANKYTGIYKGGFILVEAFLCVENSEAYLLAKSHLVTSRPYDYDLDIELPRLLYGNLRKTLCK
ncbi:MAG: hypothetical protein H0Z25_06995 [Kosmotoga sp.]|uniref:hypothetical protein n=1 Tax=Kosmotoga sp. TaxID=1955248 RepID=UPI001D9DC394|nr:hypothetical protein [Kosmotoga sp.]MBO8166946.1 hypothetical protein [Kosmotoga sp.]